MATRECATSPETTLQTVCNSRAHQVGGKTRRSASVWPPGGRLRSRPSPEERGRPGSGWPVGREQMLLFRKGFSEAPHLLRPLFLLAMFHFSHIFTFTFKFHTIVISVQQRWRYQRKDT